MTEPAQKIGFRSDLKMVRIRGPHGLKYSLRWVDAEGVETDIIASYSELSCHRFEKAIRQLEDRSDASKIAVMLASSLVTISALAARIRDAGDQAGQDGYATKAHMRNWAREILHYATPALEHSGVLPVLDEREEKINIVGRADQC